MKYRLFIVAATVIWGSSFVIMKDVTNQLPPAWILALRFTGAAGVMAVGLLGKRIVARPPLPGNPAKTRLPGDAGGQRPSLPGNRQSRRVSPGRRGVCFERSHVACGLLFGLAMFCAYYLQTVGLTDTTPGKNAFLTGTYCVIVPFLAWAGLRRRPNRYNMAAAFLCIVGVGFISLDDSLSIGFGDAMTLAGACFYALHIVLVSKFAPGRDVYVLTMWQFVGVAAISWVVALALEPMQDVAALSGACWGQLVYLTLACTTVALLFQNIGQAHVPPASASLLLSLEAVFGVAFSVAFGAEQLTLRVVVGFALVFAAIVVSEVLPERAKAAR